MHCYIIEDNISYMSGPAGKPHLWKYYIFSDKRIILYRTVDKFLLSKIMPRTIKIQHASISIPFSKYCKIAIQLKLVNSNSLNSNFRITRVFPPVPTFFLHKVTKSTSDNSKSDNSKFRLTRGDFLVPRP